MLAYLIHTLLLIGIVYWTFKKNTDVEIAHFFLPSLLLKVVAGIGVGVLYRYFYGFGDTLFYFSDARLLSQLFIESWQDYFLFLVNQYDMPLHFADNPRALFFVKLISPIVIYSGQSYWLTSVYLSLISFYASWYLVVVIKNYYPSLLMGVVVGFLFFPSVVFWSSGLIKESVAMMAIAILAANFLQLMNDEELSWQRILFALFLLFLLFKIKYYYLAAFLLAGIPTLLLKYIQNKIKVKRPLFSWMVLFVLMALGVSLLHPNLSIERFMGAIVENNKLYENHYELARSITYYQLENNIGSLLINAPIAMFSILFRPFLFETSSWLQIALSIENLLLLAIILVAAYHTVKRKIVLTPLLLTCVVYVLVLGVFLGLSTPNFGSLSRYRISFLPFVILLSSFKSPLFQWLNRMNLKYISQKS